MFRSAPADATPSLRDPAVRCLCYRAMCRFTFMCVGGGRRRLVVRSRFVPLPFQHRCGASPVVLNCWTLSSLRAVRCKHDGPVPALSPALQSHLKSIVAKHAELTAELQSEETLTSSSPAEIASKSKQLASLNAANALAHTWAKLPTDLEQTRQLIAECDASSKEGREMAALGVSAVRAFVWWPHDCRRGRMCSPARCQGRVSRV